MQTVLISELATAYWGCER